MDVVRRIRSPGNVNTRAECEPGRWAPRSRYSRGRSRSAVASEVLCLRDDGRTARTSSRGSPFTTPDTLKADCPCRARSSSRTPRRYIEQPTADRFGSNPHCGGRPQPRPRARPPHDLPGCGGRDRRGDGPRVLRRRRALRSRVGRILRREGISVEGDARALRIELHVVVEHGLNLAEVASTVRSQVAYDVDTGLRVAAVEVVIQRVRASA